MCTYILYCNKCMIRDVWFIIERSYTRNMFLTTSLSHTFAYYLGLIVNRLPCDYIKIKILYCSRMNRLRDLCIYFFQNNVFNLK